jgi:hypothetical protein
MCMSEYDESLWEERGEAQESECPSTSEELADRGLSIHDFI